MKVIRWMAVWLVAVFAWTVAIAQTPPTPAGSSPAAATSTVTPSAKEQQGQVAACKKEATRQKLSGNARKTFMKDCTKP